MKYYRYGKFDFNDYWPSWISILMLLFFAIASILLEVSFAFCFFPIVYAAVWIWVILVPQLEQFIINNDSIISYFGRKKCAINLPDELTLVISFADICPPFAVRTAIGNRTHILKGKYAVSILHKLPLNIALETLHLNYIKTYTTSTIRTSFDQSQFIYSFVCDQCLLGKLISDRQCQIIIPETLLNQIPVNLCQINAYVDIGY